MRSLLVVCAGGALGSGLRHLLSAALLRWLGPSLPVGTLVVNLLGSFAVVVVAHLAGAHRLSPSMALALGTGVLGGFTTYSAFNLEVLRYLSSGATWTALAYVSVTVIGCILAGGAGLVVGRLF